ncbi:MAG: hypothetical protein L6Q59_07095 [Ignavibacteriaceae bacterium]|nr:hypothetical protein [Ignavibacteriaceae bacterium]
MAPIFGIARFSSLLWKLPKLSNHLKVVLPKDTPLPVTSDMTDPASPVTSSLRHLFYDLFYS